MRSAAYVARAYVDADAGVVAEVDADADALGGGICDAAAVNADDARARAPLVC